MAKAPPASGLTPRLEGSSGAELRGKVGGTAPALVSSFLRLSPGARNESFRLPHSQTNEVDPAFA